MNQSTQIYHFFFSLNLLITDANLKILKVTTECIRNHQHTFDNLLPTPRAPDETHQSRNNLRTKRFHVPAFDGQLNLFRIRANLMTVMYVELCYVGKYSDGRGKLILGIPEDQAMHARDRPTSSWNRNARFLNQKSWEQNSLIIFGMWSINPNDLAS